jgi:anti-sigma B factor antagonist
MAENSAPSAKLALTVDKTPAEITVHGSGKVTSDTAQDLKTAVRPLFSEAKNVVLDLTDVSYMDSSGLGAIVSLYVSAKSAGSHLKLINLNERLKELFSITRLGEVMTRGRDPNELILP